MSSISLPLDPVPGFCVKSKVLSQAVVPRTATGSLPQPTSTSLSDTLGALITIPKGLKVFVNIAWDANVPPPPPGSEDVIQKAMRGEDYPELNPGGWFVPVVVSDLRDDKDKAGQLALVIDCVFNTTIKSRTLKDADFKAFIIELALQRVESQTSLSLSRQIGTPNIASKGKLATRQVLVPELLFPPGHPHHKSETKTNLIQEIASLPGAASAPRTKGILKSTSNSHTPMWTWSKNQCKIRIMIDVPNVTHSDIPNSTLDVEPRRVILHVPSLYDLDINLDAAPGPDAMSRHELLGEGALELKSLRDLDVDGAKAVWKVAEKVIVLLA
ncbi:pre-RNA processing PIH1/Nop17-domain-containing protein [Suillus paluster]|uniref:pre-RNA processing PIH1/Nop17-domain-containing protein n=1 Tax=Suillus paluster TaxID=48578 RepID=UPI001B87894C|nr:pre-RNA processing PIH1/Nop17-domain-containing protein [Suillus paluster]KAG1728849.1 pre-RNA processing PIH1/Nop17-domain-containing protein [Suillus paluster]